MDYVATSETWIWFNRAIPEHRDLIEVGENPLNPLVRIGHQGSRAGVYISVRTQQDAERLAEFLRDIACPPEEPLHISVRQVSYGVDGV